MNTYTTKTAFKWALLFPGQGSQYVRMGQDIYNTFKPARLVFEEACSILNLNLTKLIFEGDQKTLIKTENAQPAIMTVSYALFKTLQDEFGFDLMDKARFVLGHSFGEITALVVSGCLDFEDGLKLSRSRGLLMKKCIEGIQGSSCMRALFLPINNVHKIEELIKKLSLKNPSEIVDVASVNSSSQMVLSGSVKGIDKILMELQKNNIPVTTSINLSVSGPFHSRLMKPARDALELDLQKYTFKKPKIPMFSNYTGKIVTEKEDAKDLLLHQMENTVRWYDSILVCKNYEVNRFLCFGPSKVIFNLVKKDFPSDYIKFYC